ncbi:MAG: hypothetical protein JWL69_4914 [Phycisphaerales bacterium]|nr:hypothetical protein [Phycisphaerales bacterium]
MIQRHERPHCRKAVERILQEENCSLEDIIAPDQFHRVSEAMRIQVRKMIEDRDSIQISASNRD